MSPDWKKLVGGDSNVSLHGLRNKLTKGLEVHVEQPDTRRGADVDARVVITTPEGLGEIEVGLVCTESYDEHSGGEDGGRTTFRGTAHESWQALPSMQGEHSATLTVPSDGPFSYSGSCLSYKWEVVARGRKARALDARASYEIRVRP